MEHITLLPLAIFAARKIFGMEKYLCLILCNGKLIAGLYNAAGPGQKPDEQTCQTIKEIKNNVDMKMLVTLSCTMCPDLVVACQRIATLNPNVRAETYDIQCFDELRKKYSVMSVPCLVINNDKVSFGKKNINQVLELIKKQESE